MKPSSRLFIVFCAGLIAGLAGETLLLLKRHCSGIESALQSDFRVLAFLKGNPAAERLKVLEEKFRALEGVEEALFVSRDEALSRLRQRDPELVEAVTWLGESPLPHAFELRLSPGSLGRFPQWLDAAATLSEWAELRYKPGQVRAILQVQFYGRFIGLVVGAAFCVATVLLLSFFWGAGSGAFPVRRQLPAACLAALGAGAGMAAACLAVYPMRHYFPWWSLPAASQHLLLLAAASALGWVFCPWIASD
jgi:hypothetical protein